MFLYFLFKHACKSVFPALLLQKVAYSNHILDVMARRSQSGNYTADYIRAFLTNWVTNSKDYCEVKGRQYLMTRGFNSVEDWANNFNNPNVQLDEFSLQFLAESQRIQIAVLGMSDFPEELAGGLVWCTTGNKAPLECNMILLLLDTMEFEVMVSMDEDEDPTP